MTTVHAQIDIVGTVQDSVQAPLPGVSVMLLKASDSTLASFALADSKGRYRLSRIVSGEYVLQLNMLGYAQHRESLSVEGEADMEMPPISLAPEDFTLEAVSIESRQSPIRMKGDTLEYDANAFNPEAGESVEDLLKRLPGMEVDRDGNVEAMGETVQRVLVDGKEFFGDDPQVATKNLPADAIENVQVFDQETDAEQFTGVDDGQIEQTINLELKEDRKRGIFGTLEAAGGTEERFALKGNLNHFSPGTQISGLGQFNNLNQQGFGIEEYIQFMGGIQSLITSGGNLTLNSDGGESGVPLSLGQEQGFITSAGAGLNYNQELGEHLRLSTSYFFSGLNRDLDQERYREQFLDEGSFITEETRTFNSRAYNHRLNTRLRHFGDTINRFNLSVNMGWNQGNSFDQSQNQSLDSEGNLENAIDREVSKEGQKADARLSMSYQRNLGRRGRTISVNLSANGALEDRTGLLQSYNQLYPSGVLVADSLRQDQGEESEELGYQAGLAYTEPLGEKHYLSGSYRYQNYTDQQNQEVFDLWPERNLNAQLTNSFRRDFAYQRAGLQWTFDGEDTDFGLEVNGQQATLQGEVLGQDSAISQTYYHLLPAARISQEITRDLRIGLRYSTEIQAPTIQQLQPVVDNRDPFNLFVGNPDLVPAYQHNLNFNLNFYDQFNFVGLFMGMNGSYVQNPVVESRSIDSLFRSIRTPINVKEAWRANSYASFSAPIRPMGIKFNLDTRWNFQQNIAFINNSANDVTRHRLTGDLRLENRNKEQFDVAIGAELTQNWAFYSEASDLNRIFLNQRYYVDALVEIGEHWQLRSSLDWAVYGQEVFQDDLQVPLWRASVQRGFLSDKLRVSVEAFDILNRNQGLDRTAELNYLEEVRTQTLSRYFLLKVSYSITSLGAQR